MKRILTTVALIALPTLAVSATIDRANIVDGNTYKPALVINGQTYATTHRLSASEAEAFAASIGVQATMRREANGVTVIGGIASPDGGAD